MRNLFYLAAIYFDVCKLDHARHEVATRIFGTLSINNAFYTYVRFTLYFEELKSARVAFFKLS